MPPSRIQDRKHGGYSIRSTLDRIEIGSAIAHRWQVISKPPTVLLLRIASQTKVAFSHCYASLESFLKAKWHMIRPPAPTTIPMHVYEVRPRTDKRGVDLISDAFRFGALWYAGPNAIRNAIGFARHRSRSHDAVIRIYDEAGNVIETHEHAGDFKECSSPFTCAKRPRSLSRSGVIRTSDARAAQHNINSRR